MIGVDKSSELFLGCLDVTRGVSKTVWDGMLAAAAAVGKRRGGALYVKSVVQNWRGGGMLQLAEKGTSPDEYR